MNLMHTIDSAIDQTLSDIQKAANDKDISVIKPLTNKVGELQELKDQALSIENRVRVLMGRTQNVQSTANNVPSTHGTEKYRRKLYVHVSQGMINQNLLTLTDNVKRGKIRVGDIMNIEVQPSGDRFQSEVLVNGNKLKERGKIGRFYKDARVREGDYVVLCETDPGRWIMRKADDDEKPSYRSFASTERYV
jgi:hypothetical protein